MAGDGLTQLFQTPSSASPIPIVGASDPTLTLTNMYEVNEDKIKAYIELQVGATIHSSNPPAAMVTKAAVEQRLTNTQTEIITSTGDQQPNSSGSFRSLTAAEVQWDATGSYTVKIILDGLSWSQVGVLHDIRVSLLNPSGDYAQRYGSSDAITTYTGWLLDGPTNFDSSDGYPEVLDLRVLNGSNTEGGGSGSPATLPGNIAKLTWRDMKKARSDWAPGSKTAATDFTLTATTDYLDPRQTGTLNYAYFYDASGTLLNVSGTPLQLQAGTTTSKVVVTAVPTNSVYAKLTHATSKLGAQRHISDIQLAAVQEYAVCVFISSGNTISSFGYPRASDTNGTWYFLGYTKDNFKDVELPYGATAQFWVGMVIRRLAAPFTGGLGDVGITTFSYSQY